MIPRRTAVTRGKPPRKVNRKRKASEFARCYGSKERVQWVKSLPCAVPNCDGQPIENAHALGGGAGRKADYQLIAPLCRAHHRYLHQHGTHQFAWTVTEYDTRRGEQVEIGMGATQREAIDDAMRRAARVSPPTEAPK